MRHLFLLIAATVLSLSGWSQNRQVTDQDLVWYRYRNLLQLDTNWSVSVEVENRRFLSPHRSHQLLPGRIALHRKLGQGWEAAVGFVYFLQCLPQEANSEIVLIRPEIRPHQEILHRSKIGPWQFRQRLRIEERFFRNTIDHTLAKGYRFNWRFRYRFRVDYRLWEANQRHLSLYAFDEVMLNAGREIGINFFDQNRIAGGFHYGITPSWAMDVAYIHWFQQRSSVVDFYNRHILRITLTQYLRL